MELIPTLIVVALGGVIGLGALVAGTGRTPAGAHSAAAANTDRDNSWQAPRFVSADS
jgi:O-antigen ligase